MTRRHSGNRLVPRTLIRPTVLVAVLAASPTLAAQDEPLAVVTRGMTGRLVITDDGPALQPRADLGLEATLVARIAERTPASDGEGPGTTYTIEFMGTVEGAFDLRTALQRPDGSFPDDLPALPVSIERNLDAAAGTDVFVTERPAPTLSSVYRAVVIGILVLWALVPIALLANRLRRRLQVEPPVPETPAPTLAERLEPLALAAADGRMTVDERGRLELLLVAHLGEAAGVAGRPPAEAIDALRRRPDAGPLLTAVESWLHRPGATDDRRRHVAELLVPFRRAAGSAPTESPSSPTGATA